MERHNVRRVPVLGDDELTGVIPHRDFLPPAMSLMDAASA
ncbi:hypothetical protein CIW50_18830 [Tardiphaga sp. P9-11]|jgi:hypothetical protein|nr:hypothetical protein CIW50_18830 [Tardiphaga sp. P9-11]